MKKILFICLFIFGCSLQWQEGNLYLCVNTPETKALGNENPNPPDPIGDYWDVDSDVVRLNIRGTHFEYDGSGNRISRRTITFTAPNPAPGLTGNNEDDLISTGENNFSMFTTMEMPENNEFSDNFYTDKLNESDVVIYPNPTRGVLAVEIRNKNPEIPHHLTVFNLSGATIFQKPHIGNYTQIDLSRQPKGVYLLRISSQNSAITWKIIKE